MTDFRDIMTEHSPSKERVEFERWLFEVQGLESEWEPHRNCHKDFAAHLAFKAWQAARSTHEPSVDAVQLEGLNRRRAQFNLPPLVVATTPPPRADE